MIQIFLAHGQVGGRTNKGVPGGPRGPKKIKMSGQFHTQINLYFLFTNCVLASLPKRFPESVAGYTSSLADTGEISFD